MRKYIQSGVVSPRWGLFLLDLLPLLAANLRTLRPSPTERVSVVEDPTTAAALFLSLGSSQCSHSCGVRALTSATALSGTLAMGDGTGTRVQLQRWVALFCFSFATGFFHVFFTRMLSRNPWLSRPEDHLLGAVV